jgi:hypothetical protein
MEIDMFDWNRSCSYDEQQKRRFHTTARSRLKKLAAELALPSGSFDLRSNKAGIAVSDEITLHHDRVYIQVGQFGMSSGHGILIRTCKGRKDYTGGPNHPVALTMLDDIPVTGAMVPRLKALGLISEIISWKLRLFIPTGGQGSAMLAALLERHTLVGLTDRTAAA